MVSQGTTDGCQEHQKKARPGSAVSPILEGFESKGEAFKTLGPVDNSGLIQDRWGGTSKPSLSNRKTRKCCPFPLCKYVQPTLMRSGTL